MWLTQRPHDVEQQIAHIGLRRRICEGLRRREVLTDRLARRRHVPVFIHRLRRRVVVTDRLARAEVIVVEHSLVESLFHILSW